MKEQSHKDEMSAAIRGDFRRLRERGVAATIAPPEEPPETPSPDRERGTIEPPAGPAPALAAAPEPETEEPASGTDESSPRAGFFSRLFGR